MAASLNRLNQIRYMMDPIRQVEQNFVNEDYPDVDNMTYEEILALEDRMGNVHRGFTREQINVIINTKY